MLGVWMVAYHRASIDKVLTIVLNTGTPGSFHGSTNFELSRRGDSLCACTLYYTVYIVSFKSTPLDSVTYFSLGGLVGQPLQASRSP